MIRHPTADDVDTLAAVHVEAWTDAYTGLLPDETIAGMTLDRRVEMWQQIIEADRERAWLAEDGSGVVGLASVGPAQDLDGWGQLYNIYAVGRAWGTGAGSALWEAAQEGLTKRGYSDRQSYVLDANQRARRFSAYKGWIHDGTELLDDCFGKPIREVRYVPASAARGR